jgi:threonine aldolase
MSDVDLRSDTLTQPTEQMRQAMARAEVGDDVYGEDPTVVRLEERAAELLGQEAALFCASGSLANLLGLWLLAGPGREVLCDAQAHIVRAELGAHALLHGITTRTWDSPDGVVEVERVAALAADPSPHLMSTAAVELENTHNFGGGTVQPVETVRRIASWCAEHGLGLHLDGARLGNAAVAAGQPLAAWAGLATTVTFCLSKGLGAPIGSLLASSRDNVERARVQRKRLGAGWRQAGLMAAGGLWALEHNLERLADDHANARLLAQTVAERAPWAAPADVPTNIVVFNSGPHQASLIAAQAAAEGVKLSVLGPDLIRAVTHLGVEAEQCRRAGAILGRLLAQAPTA